MDIGEDVPKALEKGSPGDSTLAPGVPLQLPLHPWALFAHASDGGRRDGRRACADLLAGATGRHEVWLLPEAPQWSVTEGRMGGMQALATDGTRGPDAGGHDAAWMEGTPGEKLASRGVLVGAATGSREAADAARGEGPSAAPCACVVPIRMAAATNPAAREEHLRLHVEECAVAADVERAIRMGTTIDGKPPCLHVAGHRYCVDRPALPVRSVVPPGFAEYAGAGAIGGTAGPNEVVEACYSVRLLPKALPAAAVRRGAAIRLESRDIPVACLQVVHSVLALARRMPGFEQRDMWGAVRFLPFGAALRGGGVGGVAEHLPPALVYDCSDGAPPVAIPCPDVFAVWAGFRGARWCLLPHDNDAAALEEVQERAARTAACACACVLAQHAMNASVASSWVEAAGRDEALLELSESAKKAQKAAWAASSGQTEFDELNELLAAFEWEAGPAGFPVPAARTSAAAAPSLARVVRRLAERVGATTPDEALPSGGAWTTGCVSAAFDGSEGDVAVVCAASKADWLLPTAGGAAAVGEPAPASNPFGASHATPAYVPSPSPIRVRGDEPEERLPAAAAAHAVLFAGLS